MRIEVWAEKQITDEMEQIAMDRLTAGAEIVADAARAIVHTGEARPQYKNGKAWTERIPGTLRASIRVVRLRDKTVHNVRVYAGERQSDKVSAYYAHMVEFGTSRTKALPFLRPALAQSKSAIMAIMEKG